MRTTLNDGWKFSQVASDTWPDVQEAWEPCKVPTSVHVELQRLGRIPDPFKDLNEWECQWVQEADWVFRTTFRATAEQLAAPRADLVLEGLDTYCTVRLNGAELAATSNMFLAHRLDVRQHLREGENALELRFAAPLLAAKRVERENGGPRALWNGDSSRLYSRKAQYGWGWDWGPIIMTAGPWKPVHLETYACRIADLRVDADLGGAHWDAGSLAVSSLEIAPAPPEHAKVAYTLTDPGGKVVKQAILSAAGDLPKWEIEGCRGWWPVGYGAPDMYALEVAVLDASGAELASASQRVGFRHAAVVQEPLAEADGGGSSFLFEVNGVRVFCGGSNWIPADVYLTEISAERYQRWVDLLVRGNQNMLRVWGGGVYEADELYAACDAAGVLVWQDFMFGCGLYPSYKRINDSIRAEAEQAVRRLRKHPSVVIFTGNNEDYQIAEEQGVVDYDDESGDYMHTKFPARHIYEILLPDVVDRLSNVFYWRSSPYGGKTSGDLAVGDVHQWNVWHGTQEPWSHWDKLAGRFVSEFGMQGYPSLRTVRSWFSPGSESQMFPQSRTSVNHNKADGFERRLELYLMENFRHAFDMPSYVFYTQAMQAETLAAAYRLWRRNWKGRGRELTAGALVWQLNDCWPCVSWAICDYYLRPKPAFFAVARELRPLTVGMARADTKTCRDGSYAFFEIRQDVQVWACNATLQEERVRVELVAFDLERGEVGRRHWDVALAPNASTEVWAGAVPGQPVRTSDAQVPRPVVLQARVLRADGGGDSGGDVLARYSNWPEPWKYLTFPDPGLRIAVDGDEVTISVQKPVKGLVLDTEGDADECEWSDQALDMFPGDTQVLTAKGLRGRAVTARYIGDGSA